MELVRGASAANNFVFLQWDTYGVARDRPTVAGEVVEPPSRDEAKPTPRPALDANVRVGVFEERHQPHAIA
jgi:hypothetical protein